MPSFQGYKLIITMLAGCLMSAQIGATPISALHWWTSESERASEKILAEAFAEQGLSWQQVAVSGGAGEGALKVLRAKVLAQQSPDIAQVVGPSIRDWAELGFFHTMEHNADLSGWQHSLAKPILPLVSLAGEPFAIPTSVHRINTLIYNKAMFAQLGIEPAANWTEFVEQLAFIQAQGIQPLAQSTQPWQLATLFEVILASTLTPTQYSSLVVQFDRQAIMSEEVKLAFERLRTLQPYIELRPAEDWQSTTRSLYDGHAAMQIMGDWAKAEMALLPSTEIFALGCTPFLQRTEHLYSVDSFVIFNHVDNQTARIVAQTLSDPDVQRRFSQAKGTIPARADLAVTYDDCAARSFDDFRRHTVMPSVVHRAANNEAVRNVFIHVVDRFIADSDQSAEQAQLRLDNELTALRPND